MVFFILLKIQYIIKEKLIKNFQVWSKIASKIVFFWLFLAGFFFKKSQKKPEPVAFFEKAGFFATLLKSEY